jgi:hypothetical protein
MANIEITNNDLGSIEIQGGQFRDDTLRFAAADTFAKGTILARRAVAIAVTASAVTGTGNGTVTLATVVEGPIVPLVGAYVLTCVTAVANGGIFKLVDPNGAIVASDIKMTVGAGAATVVEVAGLRFTITDGATDFVAGDFFTLTVAADGALVPFNPAGAATATTSRRPSSTSSAATASSRSTCSSSAARTTSSRGSPSASKAQEKSQ